MQAVDQYQATINTTNERNMKARYRNVIYDKQIDIPYIFKMQLNAA